MLRTFLDQYGLLWVGGRQTCQIRNSQFETQLSFHVTKSLQNFLMRKSIWDSYTLVPHCGNVSFTKVSHYGKLQEYSRCHSWLHHLQTCGWPNSPSAVGATSSWQAESRNGIWRGRSGLCRPLMLRSGSVHRPVITKAYVCVFVSFIVKAVHLEAVSELSAATLIVFLHRLIAQRGKPAITWSNHGTNLVWAGREWKDFYTHLKNAQTEHVIDAHSLLIRAFCGALHLNMLHPLVGYGKWQCRAWSATSGILFAKFVLRSRSWPRYWLRWKHVWIPGHWHLFPNRKMG